MESNVLVPIVSDRNITRRAGKLTPAPSVEVAHSTDTVPLENASVGDTDTRIRSELSPGAGPGVTFDQSPFFRQKSRVMERNTYMHTHVSTNRAASTQGKQ